MSKNLNFDRLYIYFILGVVRDYVARGYLYLGPDLPSTLCCLSCPICYYGLVLFWIFTGKFIYNLHLYPTLLLFSRFGPFYENRIVTPGRYSLFYLFRKNR